ncbi:hypothetical protein BCR34DRAFT_584533 [Clohesyomyces aquaticus]|uniref:Thiaminase-2/PQQC domain-containing protein n=1 Tax=Clohesyomyces aquaticus TaxID=1231657 RepID=A0A1Y2A179_9PLEO|nr:hypothetical protein BCR34DRAFT_584533 [Clohesyomyces aquaticus]
MPSTNSSRSLSSHLLSLNVPQFTQATQSPFLRLAAKGRLPKSTISHWLANDRMYMQGYIRLTGKLMLILPLPLRPTPSKNEDTVEVRLLDWLVDALVNIRREERFFIDVTERYGLDLDLVGENETIPEDRKIEGLRRYEQLFNSLTTQAAPANEFLPWLEGAVLFWATEKVYFEAWSWAKRQIDAKGDQEQHGDDDGGAMRNEFIPNWTNGDFITFVDTLECIINDGVNQAVGEDAELKRQICQRAEQVWKATLDAEVTFWPRVEVQ